MEVQSELRLYATRRLIELGMDEQKLVEELVDRLCLTLGLCRPGWQPNPHQDMRVRKGRIAWYGGRKVWVQ
jgi:hypothetical protein